MTRLDGGRLRFDYAEEYVADAAATPISVSMPLELTRHGHDRVAPWSTEDRVDPSDGP